MRSLNHRTERLYRRCAFPTTTDYFDPLWNWSRRFFFTLTVLSLFGSKFLHLYAHLYSLTPSKFFLWGSTFFLQDVAFTLLTRVLTKKFPWRWLEAAAAAFVVPFSLALSGMASANVSFYLVAGAEINWRQAKTFQRDAAAIRTLLTGLTGFLIVEAILVVVSWLIAAPMHRFIGGILHVLAEPFKSLFERSRSRVQQIHLRNHPLPDPETYAQAASDDYQDDKSDDGESENGFLLDTPHYSPPQRKPIPLLKRIVVWVPFFVLVGLRSARPPFPSYMFLSGALPVMPFAGRHRPTLGEQAGHIADYRWLEGRTALAAPPAWDWLPETPLPGFEDWDAPDGVHYSPAQDPLHLSNLQQPVLDSLRDVLSNGDVKIKHVFLLKLESTRGDVFPLRNGSFIWDKIVDSFDGKPMPQSVEKFVSNLTRTAEFLTGFDSGFDKYREGKRQAYGGISASNAFTTGTYTLKSLVGTVCGITPLVVDFNREFDHHIYQPCMPHVLNALSHQQDITRETDDYRTWPWHSAWMQSVTDTYDNQGKLTPKLGYHDVQTRETIESVNAKHYPLTYGEVNYYGYPDTELREYVRDAIDAAEANNTRLFLTHLTGTTHHPWGMPDGNFTNILGPSFKGDNSDLNRYLNTIGFADKWLAEILDILEEKGIADETLVVMAGDHGLSLPNDGGNTPYNNPHISSFHVPIVFAHPRLPMIEVKEPVISLQVLPTILDLLIESSSLGPNGTRAAQDIQGLYEGQSMIRPLSQQAKGMEDWQFSVMNTGGTWLAVRSAAQPTWRLVVPLIGDVEWRFTDIEHDPLEKHPISSFSFDDLTIALWKKYAHKGDMNGKQPGGRSFETFSPFSRHHPPPPGHHPPPPPPPGHGHHPPPPPVFFGHNNPHHGNHSHYEPEVIRWVRDAAHIADWWISDNWRRYQYEHKR